MRRIFAVVVLSLLNLALPYAIVGQDHATPQEVVAKVREAANTLSKTRDLAQFNQKEGPWVWKDTYIFVNDCHKKVVVAHPFRPEQLGNDFGAIRGHQGQHPLPGPGRLLQGREAAFRHLDRVLVAKARGKGRLAQGQLLLEC